MVKGVISLLSGVIVAGGAHHGMDGEHRAFLELGGETLIARQIREMRSCCDEITIVTGDPERFLRTVERDIRIISDYYQGDGLLSGFHAGLALAGHRHVWVLGCHMPFPSAQAAELLQARLSGGGTAALPFVGEALYPLHGIYRKDAAALSGRLLGNGRSAFSELLNELDFVKLGELEFEQSGIGTGFVQSIRTKEDFRQLKQGFPLIE